MKVHQLVLPCLTLALGITSITPAHAYLKTLEENASKVDLRDNLGIPMPMRVQSRLSICYAYTASDFLQYHYQLPEPMSPLDVSTTAFKSSFFHRVLEWIRNNFTGTKKESDKIMAIDPPEQGFIRLAMKQVIKDGYCPESVFPSDFWTKRYPDGHEEKIEARQAIRESIGLSQAIQNETIKSVKELPYFYALPDFSEDQYFNFLSKTNDRRFMPELQGLLCSGKRKQIVSNGDEKLLRTKIKGRRTFQRINRALDQKQVASVDLFGTLFVHMTGFKYRLGSLHTVLIMGREFDKEMNEVRYLIRDTHGPACVGHENGEFPPFDSRLRCVGGYLQVPESALYKAMLTYTYYDLQDDKSADDQDEDIEALKQVETPIDAQDISSSEDQTSGSKADLVGGETE